MSKCPWWRSHDWEHEFRTHPMTRTCLRCERVEAFGNSSEAESGEWVEIGRYQHDEALAANRAARAQQIVCRVTQEEGKP